MRTSHTVAEVLAQTGAILLDFDGPVCAVFATVPAQRVAADLRRAIAASDAAAAALLPFTDDPLELLRHIAVLDMPELTVLADELLCRAELLAVAGATPTPHVEQMLVQAQHAQRPVAIVSNNSRPAIEAYLSVAGLRRYIGPVVGRPFGQPLGMKPSPDPIIKAAAMLGAVRRSCVLVGDSVTDIESARAAGIWSIGIANRPQKHDRLIEAGADAVADGTEALAELVTAMLP